MLCIFSRCFLLWPLYFISEKTLACGKHRVIAFIGFFLPRKKGLYNTCTSTFSILTLFVTFLVAIDTPSEPLGPTRPRATN